MRIPNRFSPPAARVLEGHMAAGAGAMLVFLTSWVIVVWAEGALRRLALFQSAYGSLLLCAGAYLLWLLLSSPLSCGEAARQWALSCGESAPFSTLFFCFGQGRAFGRALLAGLLTGAGKLLWTAAFLFPPALLLGAALRAQGLFSPDSLWFLLAKLTSCICFALLGLCAFFLWVFLRRYELVFFYLTQFPGLSVFQVAALSARQTRGYRLKFAGIRLRRLPLLLFFPLVWPVPACYCLIGAARADMARALAKALDAAPIPLNKRRTRFRRVSKRRNRLAKRIGNDGAHPLRRPGG